jgi:hypothetical protein
MIVLNEFSRTAQLGELAPVIAFQKKAARVPKNRHIHNKQALEGRRDQGEGVGH